MAETGAPVEYGAIEIVLEAFSPEVRGKILEEHLPLGGLLNEYGVAYYSRPRAFLRLGADDDAGPALWRAGVPGSFMAAANELLSADGDASWRALWKYSRHE